MSTIPLSFRRKRDPYQWFRDNPGIRWNSFIPVQFKPIKYLEIGVSEGVNIVDIAKSYCAHPESKMYCVDPWQDYDEYPEYKGQQGIKYKIAMNNIAPYADKCIIHRGFSDNIVSLSVFC